MIDLPLSPQARGAVSAALSKFAASQARAPKGSAIGGQWIRTEGGPRITSIALTMLPAGQRVFNGQPVAIKTKLSKQAAGALGEQIITSYLRQRRGMQDADTLNVKRNNFPLDLLSIRGRMAFEVKTGMASNGKAAQQWRMTIGEPGKKEKLWLKNATPAAKARWNAQKQSLIRQRKNQALRTVSKELGVKIVGKTFTVILHPDRKMADIYEFDGWHNRIAWSSSQAARAYRGTVRYSGA